ncbi:MAG: hypothetical protein ACM34E_12070, partial [Acidobacteriota bacterium]
FPDATLENGVVRFAVPTVSQRSALEQVWSLGGQVISVNPEHRSLEEIFLQLTTASGERNGSA